MFEAKSKKYKFEGREKISHHSDVEQWQEIDDTLRSQEQQEHHQE